MAMEKDSHFQYLLRSQGAPPHKTNVLHSLSILLMRVSTSYILMYVRQPFSLLT